jgi:hypothetical protein
MPYGVLADLVLVVHLGFVLFVALGGLLVLRWPRLAWIHLRRLAGEAGYAGGFIEHYVTAVLYPDGLTRVAQVVLGTLVLLVNAVIYRRILRR